MTATSGRHGRSCDGRIEMNQPSTTRNSPAKANRIRGRRVSHKAQTLNAAKATASASRNHAQGRLE
ncbi:MAG TPA: hypothetical protein VGF55_02385 [Gemmataceae bacterium]